MSAPGKSSVSDDGCSHSIGQRWMAAAEGYRNSICTNGPSLLARSLLCRFVLYLCTSCWSAGRVASDCGQACRGKIEQNITAVARGARTKEAVLQEAVQAFHADFLAAQQKQGTTRPHTVQQGQMAKSRQSPLSFALCPLWTALLRSVEVVQNTQGKFHDMLSSLS